MAKALVGGGGGRVLVILHHRGISLLKTLSLPTAITFTMSSEMLRHFLISLTYMEYILNVLDYT